MCVDEYAPVPPGLLSNPGTFRKALLLGSVGVAIALLFLWWLNTEPAVASSGGNRTVNLQKAEVSNKPLQLKMFSWKTFNENGPHFYLSADLLEVRPRRFMAFNIKSINEAVLENAHLEFFTYSNKEFDIQFSDFENAIPFGRKGKSASERPGVLGRVTRLVIQKPTVDFMRDNSKVMELAAATALLEKKKQGLRFFNAALRDMHSHRTIKAKEISWDGKRKAFVVPGKYSETGPSGSVTGTSIQIKLNFEITPLGSGSGR